MRAITTDIIVSYANGTTADFYVVAPCYGTLKEVRGVLHGDPGDADYIDITDASSNDLGQLLFGSSVSAGSKGTWTGDATAGNTHVDKGDAIKLTCSSGGAVVDAWVQIEWDPDGLDHV